MNFFGDFIMKEYTQSWKKDLMVLTRNNKVDI
jgi:hypothetical protein